MSAGDNTIDLLWHAADLPVPVLDARVSGDVVALRDARREMAQGRRKPKDAAVVLPGDVVAALLPQPKIARRF
jgi:hypothetical protein